MSPPPPLWPGCLDGSSLGAALRAVLSDPRFAARAQTLEEALRAEDDVGRDGELIAARVR